MADAFKVGDLVWAKMKTYPYWPARITDPPDHIKPPTSKKGKHCVCFFGTNDFAWIPEDCIVFHSEERANSTKSKPKTSAGLLKAIQEITDFKNGDIDNGTSSSVDSASENDASSETSKSPSSPKGFQKKKTIKKKVKKSKIFDSFSSTESIPSSIGRENDANVLSSSDNSQEITEKALTKEAEPRPKKTCNLTSLTKSSSNESLSSLGGGPHDLFPTVLNRKDREFISDDEDKKIADFLENYSTSESDPEEKKEKEKVVVTRKRRHACEPKKPAVPPYDQTDNGPPKRPYFECPPTPAVEMVKGNYLIAKDIKITDKKIGFLGINKMSAGVLKNLLLSGHKVTIFDDKCKSFEPYIEAGASIAQNADDVVASCDITFGYLADINAVKYLMYSNFGILKGLEGCEKGAKGYVEMTPIDVATALEFDKAFMFYGQRYMIAPIVGSRQSADEGSLLCLAAGDVELFSDAYSCFSCFSRNVFYVSADLEVGCKMYLIQSMLIGTTTAALAEAMALIKKCDLAFDSFYKLIEMGPFSCQLALEKSCLMNTRNFQPDSVLNHQLLDMKMALKMANSYRQSSVVSAAATELFKRAKFLKYQDHDVSSVVMSTDIELDNDDRPETNDDETK